jgi:hypothetical protein
MARLCLLLVAAFTLCTHEAAGLSLFGTIPLPKLCFVMTCLEITQMCRKYFQPLYDKLLWVSAELVAFLYRASACANSRGGMRRLYGRIVEPNHFRLLKIQTHFFVSHLRSSEEDPLPVQILLT